MKNIIVFVSGNGTNLQEIIDNSNVYYKIVVVICNKKNAFAIKRAESANIPVIYSPYIKKNITREDYDTSLANLISAINYDLIVLAGWMHVFTNNFLSKVKKIINLHPSLPGLFPGNNSIKDAYHSFKRGEISNTGIMVHYVIEEIDAGEVISTIEVPIYDKDNLNDLKIRVQFYEKKVLMNGIKTVLDSNSIEYPRLNIDFVKHGKVRDIYTVNNELILFVHTDRLSSFDRHICDVPGKGNILNSLSTWWMNQTKHIIDNHIISSYDNILVAKRCRIIPIEVIVRGYMTGSTETSLWTHYSQGTRNYCGINFRDGYVKNQVLDTPVVTPTTKGERDELISAEVIVSSGILSQSQWDYINGVALRLFEYGQMVAAKKGLILVDTKYEFGFDTAGNIILIDELHTCDSSRYWIQSSYNELFNNQKEPKKLDKDAIRDYVRGVCDPYKVEKIPEIPNAKISSVLNCYLSCYTKLSGLPLTVTPYNSQLSTTDIFNNYISNIHQNLVFILAGSESDREHILKIQKELDRYNILYRFVVASAHKSTKKVMAILDELNASNRNIIFITVAGRSNALSGVVAAQSKYPVIACPPFKDKMDMMVNINSSLQCPSHVPVMTILEPLNAALTCKRIYSFN